jgi:hypothetical protein
MTKNITAPIVDRMPVYSCDHYAPTRGQQLPYGYIDETWLTVGGSSFRYMSCFGCRSTVAPFSRDDPRWHHPIGGFRAIPPDLIEE